MRTSLQRGASRTAALLLVSLAAAACGGEAPFDPGSPAPGPKQVAEVVVAPDTVVLPHDGTRMLAATPTAADRTPLADRTVAWSTSDSAVATVTREGVVVARGAGTAVITAVSEGRQGHARVEVLARPGPPAVASVRITPGDVTMSEDPATWTLAAKVFGPDGKELHGRAVAWSSSDTTRLRVHEGRLLPYGHGTVEVTATSEGKQARVRVTVPEWQRSHVLKGAAGLPLPAVIGTSTYVDGTGATRTVRRVVTDGALHFSFTGGRYEQRLAVQTYEDGVLAGTDYYFDRGTYLYDMLTGSPVLTSTLFAGLTFRAEPASGGALAVTQRIGGEGAPAAFVYGRP